MISRRDREPIPEEERSERWWQEDRPAGARRPGESAQTKRSAKSVRQERTDDPDEDVDAATVLHRSKLMRRSVILVAILLTVLGLASMYVMDESVPWDADLRPDDMVGGPPPAAHGLLKGAGDQLIPLAGAEGIVLESLPDDIVQSYLQANSDTLDALVTALAQTDWQPRHEVWRTLPLNRPDVWFQISVMKTLEATLLQRRGMELEAFGAGFDLMVLGLRLQELEATPSYYVDGGDLYESGALLLSDLVNRTSLTTDQLMVLQAGLARMEVSDAALQSFFRACYQVERARLQDQMFGPTQAEGEEPRADPFFKPNATQQLFASRFRELIDEVPRAHYARSARALDRLPARRQGWQRLFNANWRGEEYFSARMQGYTDLYNRQTLLKAQRGMALTLFALRRFHAIEGYLPDELDELVPAYIPEVPEDPFDGEPLRYDRRDAIVRSVGYDLADEGGWLEDEAFKAPHEPTLFIRF